MNIQLNDINYQMTTTHVVNNEVYMYLKDESGRMYQKSVNDIILLLYKNKALANLTKYQTIEELKQDLLQVDAFLSDIPAYQYIKQNAVGFKLNQDQLTQIFQGVLKAYESFKQQEVQKKVEEPKANEQQNQDQNPFRELSENELLFRLQMNPNSPDNNAIRAELENRAMNKSQNQRLQGSYGNEMIKVKKLEQRSNLGFAMNALLAFLTGMVVGIWSLVLINILVKYL